MKNDDIKISPKTYLLFQPVQSDKKDFLMSFSYLKQQAEKGDPSAQLLVGMSLCWGTLGQTLNYEKGKEWIELAAKNKGNSPAILHAQGICYSYAMGEIKIKNHDKAKQLYTEAADQGYIPAISDLGYWLHLEAVKAVSSEAFFEGRKITSNRRQIQDPEKLTKAVSLFTTAAEAGYSFSLRYLGLCYHEGDGVPKDDKEALKLLKAAAETGYSAAKREVGVFYENGWGVEADRSEARRWYRMAEEQGMDVNADISRTSCCIIA